MSYLNRKPLSDYNEPLPKRVVLAPQDLGQTAEGGPALSPIATPAKPMTEKESCLCCALAFMYQCDDEPFVFTNSLVELPAPGYGPSNQVTLVEMSISEGYLGVLHEIGFAVVPNSAMDDVSFRLEISGGAAPKLTTASFFLPAPTSGMRVPFPYFCQPKRRIQLVAINHGTGTVQVNGMIIGAMRPQNT